LIEISHTPLSASKISLQLKDNFRSHPEFVKNEIIKGQVLKTISLNDALLLINGKQVAAKTQVPLREGATLLLKVEETVPVPTLKLMGPPITGPNTVNVAVILAAMQENLWKTILENITGSGFSKENGLLFRELMHDLSTKLFTKSDPNLLKTFIDKSGLSWEKKLKEFCIQKQIGEDGINKLVVEDLKGLGSRLLSLNADKEIILNRFISTLQNIQLLNHLGLEQDGKIFLPMPIQFPNGLFTVGQLLIQLYQEPNDQHKKKDKDRSLYRISFLLELSNLGPLRADIAVREKKIDGRFLLSNQESKLLIEKNLPSLINNLQARGFVINHMECHLKKPEVIKHSLIKEMIHEEGFTVNLIA